MAVEPRLRMFISHAHEESKLALTLKSHILKDFIGIVKVFASADRADIRGGADWLQILRSELAQTDIFAVLCSPWSLQHRWVNIELGAALFRQTESPAILPLCHSNPEVDALDIPLKSRQALAISKVEELRALYDLLAESARCASPTSDFSAMATEIQTFEEEFRITTARRDQSARLLADGRGPNNEVFRNPAVLCISSKQLEESAKTDFEFIRKALPMNLHHEIVLSSEALRNELGMKHYDIIHAAIHICPFSGDLIFDDIDPETHSARSPQSDRLTAEDFARLIDVAKVSLIVLVTPEPFGFVGRLLPHTNIVFPSSYVETPAIAKWMSAFYMLLAKSYGLTEASRRASAQSCPCMKLYPMLPANSYVEYPSDPGFEAHVRLTPVEAVHV